MTEAPTAAPQDVGKVTPHPSQPKGKAVPRILTPCALRSMPLICLAP